MLKKFGKPLAALLTAAGLLMMLYAWNLSPTSYRAQVWRAGEAQPMSVAVKDALAGNWLLQAGVRLYPGDRISYAGMTVNADFKLPRAQGQSLVYQAAVPLTVRVDGQQRTFYSAALNLAQALWEEGILLRAGDAVTPALTTTLSQPLQVEIRRARPIRVQTGGSTFEVLSAADTVGQALAETGFAPQNLDRTIPEEDQPIPQDGLIRLVRVREESILEESEIPYGEERVADASLQVGQSEIRQAGQAGLRIVSLRVRYEDEQEVARTVEQEWTARAPLNQITAYGSQVVLQTSVDGECLVDYWLAKEVFVTSYRDTGSPTASGIWPYYGVIAVSPEWYSILKGSSICVPGYGVGTVLDVCPGCAGKDWLDVFIPIENYVPWSRNLTVYFMPPVPDGFSGDLP